MEDIAIKAGFVVGLAVLIAFTWRAELARAAVWKIGHPITRAFVRPSRTGHATTTLRVERPSDRKEE